MNAPEWLLDILKQFPGLAIGLAVAWYGIRVVTRIYDTQLEQVRKDTDKQVASKDREIERLVREIESLKKERDKWIREAMGRNKP